MVESAEDRSDSDSAVPALRPRSRRLQAEAAMGAIVVVVVGELVQDRTQVALAEGNQMVEALAADGPHPAFRDRVGDRFQLRAMGTVRDDFASSIPTTLWSAKSSSWSVTPTPGASTASSTERPEASGSVRCRLPGLM